MASKLRKRKPKKPRGLAALGMILAAKGGPMRDRRERRPDDARRDFRREEW